MTWQILAATLGAVVLFGAAVTALPPIWRFVVAAAKAPLILNSIMLEFAPNGGNSMRDKITKLGEDTHHLRDSNHAIAGNTAMLTGTTVKLADEIMEHTKEDAERFAVILDRLRTIEAGVVTAGATAVEVKKDLTSAAAEIKHDLTAAAEINTLGREGRVDRREP